MGDRAIVQLKLDDTYSPCLYMHWGGGYVAALLEEFTRSFLRKRGADLEYGFARLVQYAICSSGAANDVLGFGVWNCDKKCTDSHRDAGVFIVDIKNKSIEMFGGYGVKSDDDREALAKLGWTFIDENEGDSNGA